MYKITLFLTMLLFTILPSCSTRNANITRSYLNYKYILRRAGDLHGLPPTSNEVLDRNEGFTDYMSLFDGKKSYINFQCLGTSDDDFHCEASFFLYDIEGNLLVAVDNFECSYTGGQSGSIIYSNNSIEDYLGTIYVYTPYWCRWQYEYDVDSNGTKSLLTFEFLRSEYNELPDFINGEE